MIGSVARMEDMHGFGSFVAWFQIEVAVLVVIVLALRAEAEPRPGGIRQILSSKRMRIAALVLAADGLVLVLRIVRPHGLF
jgi:hypothetical protein